MNHNPWLAPEHEDMPVSAIISMLRHALAGSIGSISGVTELLVDAIITQDSALTSQEVRELVLELDKSSARLTLMLYWLLEYGQTLREKEHLMNIQQLITEANQLPLDERLTLLEALSRSIKETLRSEGVLGSSVDRVRGLLKTDELAPTDEELKSDYIDHLTEKYS